MLILLLLLHLSPCVELRNSKSPNPKVITPEFLSALSAEDPPFDICDYPTCYFRDHAYSEAKILVSHKEIDINDVNETIEGGKREYINEGKRESREYTNKDTNSTDMNTHIPPSFSNQETRSSCVNTIADQGQCGSCWAISATTVLADRMCIAGGPPFLPLSYQYVLSCTATYHCGGNGCQGCYASKAFLQLHLEGVPSASCQEYISGNSAMPPCRYACYHPHPFRKYYCGYPFVKTGVRDMKLEIMNYGPLSASFRVYRDFYAYTGGVYTHTYGEAMGNHSVRVIGWGVLRGVQYWICANSWGDKWGEGGYFRINMLTCEISNYMIGCYYNN